MEINLNDKNSNGFNLLGVCFFPVSLHWPLMVNGITVLYLLFIITNMIKYQDIHLIEGRLLWARRGCKRNSGLFSNKYIVNYRLEVPISGLSEMAGSRLMSCYCKS